MRLPLILALLALSAPPSRAKEAPLSPQAREARPSQPAPQLVHLERALMRKQEARDTGALPPEKYQEFVVGLRAELDAVMGRVPPTPENKGLHALILARLGEREQGRALEDLEQALARDPENPALLAAKGSILYEQRDFPAAAALASQAWEASSHTDQRAWALLKMSEGRASGVQSREPAPRLKPASDFARLDWSIPERHDVAPQAMAFLQQATAARRRFDFEATARYAQAAMNADPTSLTVQRFYDLVQADQLKHDETDAFIRQAVVSITAGRGTEAVAWAQKAYDRSPSDDTYSVLQDVRLRSAKLDAMRAAEQPKKAPKGTTPSLPLLAAFGAGLAAYGAYQLAKSKSTRASDGGLDPSPRVPPEQARRNYVNSAVLIGTPIVAAGIVFGGPTIWRAAAPVITTAWRQMRGGNTSLQRALASEAGAIDPGEAQAVTRAATAGSARTIPGFSVVESQVIFEARRVLSSPEFAKLQDGYRAGRPVIVNIGGRLIQYPTSPWATLESLIFKGTVSRWAARRSRPKTR